MNEIISNSAPSDAEIPVGCALPTRWALASAQLGRAVGILTELGLRMACRQCEEFLYLFTFPNLSNAGILITFRT